MSELCGEMRYNREARCWEVECSEHGLESPELADKRKAEKLLRQHREEVEALERWNTA